MLLRTLTLLSLIFITACSSWVYRLNIAQGNFIENKDIDKLQIAMTKEQVKFILGSPVVMDTFDKNTWYYIYHFKSGRSENLNVKQKFIIHFENDKIASVESDYKLKESFYEPMQHDEDQALN